VRLRVPWRGLDRYAGGVICWKSAVVTVVVCGGEQGKQAIVIAVRLGVCAATARTSSRHQPSLLEAVTCRASGLASRRLRAARGTWARAPPPSSRQLSVGYVKLEPFKVVPRLRIEFSCSGTSYRLNFAVAVELHVSVWRHSRRLKRRLRNPTVVKFCASPLNPTTNFNSATWFSKQSSTREGNSKSSTS
jgi:hypothetical protein